jgi:hypothetical protein
METLLRTQNELLVLQVQGTSYPGCVLAVGRMMDCRREGAEVLERWWSGARGSNKRLGSTGEDEKGV